jgi:hypothetical protein
LLLRCAAGAAAPHAPAAGSAEQRTRWRDAWAEWWRAHGDRVDLAKVGRAEPFLGLTLVPEMHGNTIWECGPDGKLRWQMHGLEQPRDAQLLPGGRILIAEVASNRVTERDLSGKVRNGHLVCLSMSGILREVDSLGKEVRTIRLEQKNPGGCNWSGVEGLPGNRYLAVDLHGGRVIEVDATGKTVWECQVPGASYALRLPTGNTMVCSFSGQRIVHVNREGTVVWEKRVATSPWRARYR